MDSLNGAPSIPNGVPELQNGVLATPVGKTMGGGPGFAVCHLLGGAETPNEPQETQHGSPYVLYT